MASKREQRAAARDAGMGFGDLNADDLPETSLNEIDMGLFGNLGSLTDGTGLIPTASADGMIQIGHFKLTGTGLKTDSDDIDKSEWEQIGGILRRLEGSLQWLIGDWFVYGSHRWGDMYESVAESMGYNPKTLRDYAYVARNVELSIRIDILSFAHHQLVAGKSDEEQIYWLTRARDEKLTVAKLRKAINGEDAQLGDGKPLVAPKTTKLITTSMEEAKKASQQGRQHIAAMLEEAARQIRVMR